MFKTPQNDSLMADAIAVHMKANGVKTMGYIGFADAYGDGWLGEIKRSAQTAGIKVVAEEKYNRNDASVTGQVLKLVAANPDAILIGAAGTPGATPQKELVARSYKGKIYQTHGVANPDFLRVVRQGRQRHVPADRPDARVRAAARFESGQEGRGRVHHASTKRSTARTRARRSAATPGIAFLLLSQAIPEALKKAKPGHEGVPRGAARRARGEQRRRRPTACSSMSPQDHNGLDNRARVMITHRERQVDAREVARERGRRGRAGGRASHPRWISRSPRSLTQDGVTNGAIYALLALALVLVFTVTRVIWIPSGEFVAYGTLTLAGLQLGKPPGTVGLLVGMAVVAGVDRDDRDCVRDGESAPVAAAARAVARRSVR